MIVKKLSSDKIPKYLEIIREIDMFRNISDENIKNIFEFTYEVSVTSEETLIDKYETDNSLYILVYGRLKVFTESQKKPIATIVPGDVVGEISFLIDVERTASVIASRDSLLLKIDKGDIDKEIYQDFEQKHQSFTIEMAKKSLERLVKIDKKKEGDSGVKIISIAPASNSDHIEFSHALGKYLEKKEKTIVLDAKSVDTVFNKEGFAQTHFNSSDNDEIIQWFQKLEEEHQYIILITDHELSPWSTRCLRIADRILFIANPSKSPECNSIEKAFYNRQTSVLKDSILIIEHAELNSRIKGTRYWIQPRNVSFHFHIEKNETKGFDKVYRYLTNNLVGLVLSGGGAKAFSHIGVLKAFEEHQVPIDFICGVSMGAYLSTMYSYQGLEVLISKTAKFSESYRGDYTFPYVSFFKGKNIYFYMDDYFGDARIEDLIINCFCVSTNLSKGKLLVHEKGEARKAVRMSTSLPAVFPPMYENGDIIIDGGVIDNMPVDVLKSKILTNRLIAVDCSTEENHHGTDCYYEPYISGWKLIYNKFKRFLTRSQKKSDTIIDIVMLSITLAQKTKKIESSSKADYLITIKADDYQILEFEKFHEIVDIGYQTTIEFLENNNEIKNFVD